MAEHGSFPELMARLQAGEEAAAAEIFRRYARHLIRLAAPRLAGLIRQKVDAEDIVQSAFRSFFRGNAAGTFSLEGWEDLWGLLATITLRNSRHWVRHFLTAKRHVSREEALAATPAEAWGCPELVTREPSPAEAAVLGDTVEHLLAGLDERERQVAELSLQGYSVAEIAPRVGLSERSTHRQMVRIRARLLEISDIEETSGP